MLKTTRSQAANERLVAIGANAKEGVRYLLRFVGEDPHREGLVDTPARVLRAWEEMTAGYLQDPSQILSKTFTAEYDQIIVCPWIEFYSVCEHHLLTFSGHAHLAYLPAAGSKSKVVGLSKLARLVDCFGRRLQIQEQMTTQIANALETHLRPRGVAVVVQAKHLCMACRGVQKHGAVMVTSAMRGVFRAEGPARDEFFKLVDLAARSNGQ